MINKKCIEIDQKMKDGKLLFGTLVSLGHPAVTECLAQAGYDLLWIDMEHSAMDNESALNSLIAAKAGGTPAWVRIRWDNPVLAKPILDMGADGIIFPYVRTAQEAAAAVAACAYPPEGVRGYGPWRALDYGATSQMEYVTKTFRNCKRIIQIEHIDAVENLESILQVKGIDGFIFGPNDMAGSLGLIGQIDHPQCRKTYEKATAILRNSGIPFGVATGSDPQWLNYWKDLGATIFFCGSDWGYLYSGAAAMLQGLNSSLK